MLGPDWSFADACTKKSGLPFPGAGQVGLVAIRVQGFAFDNQGAALGAQSVACAVRDRTGAAVAGLSVATPVARMRRDRFARLVRDGAQETSRRLGFQDPVRV